MDPTLEPSRGQVVRLDGRERLMLACLERTAVVELDDGERVLVRHADVEVDAAALLWQRRPLAAAAYNVSRARGGLKKRALMRAEAGR